MIKVSLSLAANQFLAVSILFLITISFSARLLAHEFWIEPTKFQLAPNQPVIANLKVGQNFKGQPIAFFQVEFFSLTISNQQKTDDIQSRFGSIPAIQQAPAGKGLNTLSYVSGYSSVTYSNEEKFIHFLQQQGLQWVHDEHKKRQLPTEGFTEIFQRFSKSLITSSTPDGEDKNQGMRLEWVLNQNPYQLTSPEPLMATLFWEGKAFHNRMATVFRKTQGNVEKTTLTTNDKGQILLEQLQPGTYMISSVHMIPTTAELAEEYQAVWHSLWASTTFEITARTPSPVTPSLVTP